MCYAVSKFQLQRSISLKSRFAGIFPECVRVLEEMEQQQHSHVTRRYLVRKMPIKAKGKKAAAKAEKKAKKGEEKARKFKALAALDAFMLKIQEELARLRKDPASLFQEPPPKQECPLCMLPIPFQPDKNCLRQLLWQYHMF